MLSVTARKAFVGHLATALIRSCQDTARRRASCWGMVREEGIPRTEVKAEKCDATSEGGLG